MKKKRVLIILFIIVFSSIKAQEKQDYLSVERNPMTLIQPHYLKKGDTVAIVAPAGILKNKTAIVNKAKQLLESWGLKVVLGKNMFRNGHHFAGSDDERCEDFQAALDDKSIKAIWAARGGYGSVRIIDKLDFTAFKKHPKWVIGYSDITAFHNHIHHLGIQSIHGMMATSLEKENKEMAATITSFQKALFGEALSYKIPLSTYNRNSLSSINGQIVGGNLTILASMLGSESQLETTAKILFIEEIGEYKYSIDRMLQSLKRAGYFKNLKAVLVGDFSNVKKNSTKWGSSFEQLILDVIPKDIPVVFNFPAGHEVDNRALIFGKAMTLNFEANHCILKFKNE